MKNLYKYLIGGLVGALVVGLGVLFLQPQGTGIGGSTSDDWIVGGNSGISGNFNASGTVGLSGAVTLSGANTLSGTSTFSGELQVDRLRFGVGSTTDDISTSSISLSAAQFCDVSFIRFNMIGASVSSTLPGSSAVINDCIPKLGDRHTVLLQNASTSASRLEFVTGDASMTLVHTSSTVDVIAVLGTLEFAELTLINTNDITNTVLAIFQQLEDVD